MASASLAVAVVAGPAAAQIVGKLRNAQQSVFDAFPEADGYRTIVRGIGRNDRIEVEKRLPFELHMRELGPHGLYVALRGKRPVGLLYLRSEESEWGFSEIVWAMDLELRVAGFAVQRSRSSHLPSLERSEFSRALRGMDRAELAELIDEDGQLKENALAVPSGARGIAGVVVTSAMKALAVTEVVWEPELHKLQDLNMALAAFPEGIRFRRLATESPALDPDEASPARRFVAVRPVQVLDEQGTPLGFVVRTESEHRGRVLVLHWKLGPAGSFVDVTATSAWADDRIRSACRDLGSAGGVPGPRSPLKGMVAELRSLLSPGGDRGASGR